MHIGHENVFSPVCNNICRYSYFTIAFDTTLCLETGQENNILISTLMGPNPYQVILFTHKQVGNKALECSYAFFLYYDYNYKDDYKDEKVEEHWSSFSCIIQRMPMQKYQSIGLHDQTVIHLIHRALHKDSLVLKSCTRQFLM